jgi:hypothetical protein
MNTAAADAVSRRLLSSNAPSRLIGAKSPPVFSIGARQAYSVSEPPTKTPRIASTKTPRAGLTAKA